MRSFSTFARSLHLPFQQLLLNTPIFYLGASGETVLTHVGAVTANVRGSAVWMSQGAFIEPQQPIKEFRRKVLCTAELSVINDTKAIEVWNNELISFATVYEKYQERHFQVIPLIPHASFHVIQMLQASLPFVIFGISQSALTLLPEKEIGLFRRGDNVYPSRRVFLLDGQSQLLTVHHVHSKIPDIANVGTEVLSKMNVLMTPPSNMRY